MTKIALSPNASGTGTFTIAAPSSNNARTFTLPDATGTVLTDQSNIEEQVKTATNASGSAPVYACRAWVNFNGIPTASIRASGNVSSVVRNSAGDYTINFTTAMPDANYALFGQSQSTSENSEGSTVCLKSANNTTPPDLMTASAVSVVRRGTFNEVRSDAAQIHIAIFR